MSNLYKEFMHLVNACNRAEYNTTFFLQQLCASQDCCCADTFTDLQRAYNAALVEHSLATARLADFVIKYQCALSFSDQIAADTPVQCLNCCHFADPDPFNPDPEYSHKFMCCWEPDEEFPYKPCEMPLPDDWEE